MARIACPHPYNSLKAGWEWRDYNGPNRAKTYDVKCMVKDCKHVWPMPNEVECHNFIMDMYRLQTGNQDIVYKDMFGTPLEVGSRVIYPVLSGRSCQITEGMIVEINPPTRGTDSPASRLDAPKRLKVMPTGRSSRWEQHGRYGTDIKPVTLSANAESAVVLPLD